jgi:tetratricopeptide (TPR) repeat protein
MYGNKAFTSRDYPTARDWYLKALSIDSNLITAAVYIAVSYANQGMYEEGEKWCNRAHGKIEVVPLNQKLLIKWLHASYFETPYEEIKYMKQILELDDQRSLPYYILGVKYNELQQYDKAITEFTKALKLHEKWGLKPIWAYYYAEFGLAYHRTAQYKKEKNLYKKGEQDFPDNDLIIRRQAILSLSQGDEKGAKRYIDKYISIRKEYSASEATIATNLAGVYEEANLPDKAEKYYREALVSEPENPYKLNALAWFLIDKDRNVKEGLELVDKALKISPDDYLIIDTKGWGLYKQGSTEQAREILKRAWDILPEYDHDILMHVQEAETAQEGQQI